MKITRLSIALFVLLLAVSILPQGSAKAQTKDRPMPAEKEPFAAEKMAVRQTINDFFDAMRAGDGDKIASLFAEGAIIQSTGTDSEGNPKLGNLPGSKFAEAVGQPQEAAWNEQIWDLKIHVNGRLASAWMNYAFYLGDNFLHCGANSFQMYRGSEGWQVLYLADTRQQSGCDIPEHLKPGGN